MTFLRNSWYMAGWAREVTRTPMVRTILGEPVVFYRSEASDIIALGDICPHRFAPLSLGKVDGDSIRCPYHGLGFGPDGKCNHSPFDGNPPGALQVQSYRVREQDTIVWIWMGAAQEADLTKLPDHAEMRDRPDALVQRGGYLHVQSEYRLVADNLLDLTHAEFLHPTLGNPGSVARSSFNAMEKEGGTVIAHSHLHDERLTGFLAMFWEGTKPGMVDIELDVVWQAPANMRLDLLAYAVDGSTEAQFRASGSHIITPETATSCHYFFGNSYNMNIDNERMKNVDPKLLGAAFKQEDVPMIEAQQRYLAIARNQGSRMAMLRTDEAVVRANRLLDARIAAEQTG